MGPDLRILFVDDAPSDALLEQSLFERDQRVVHPRIDPSEAEPRGDQGLAALVVLILDQFRRIDAVSDRRYNDQEWRDIGALLTARCRDLQLLPATITRLPAGASHIGLGGRCDNESPMGRARNRAAAAAELPIIAISM